MKGASQKDFNAKVMAQPVRIWFWLTRPATSIQDPERRRHTQVLSSVLIILFLLGAVSTLVTLLSIDHISSIFISVSGTIFLAVIYFINRAGHYNLALVLTVCTLLGSIFLLEVLNPEPGALYFLALGVSAASLFLSRRATARVMLGTIVGIGILWIFFSAALPAPDVISAMFMVLCMGLLGIITITIRQQQLEQIEKQTDLLLEDIAKREKIEASLQGSQKRFQALVEYSMEEVSLITADGTLIYESPSKRRPLGYPPNSMVGHNLLELFHPDEKDAAAQLLANIVAHPGLNQEALFRVQHQDGSWRWMEGYLTNLLHEPSVHAIVINYRDVTERQMVDEELKRRLTDFEAVTQLSSAMRAAGSLAEMLPIVLDNTLKILHRPTGSLWLYNKTKDELQPIVVRGTPEHGDVILIPPEKPGEGIAGYVFATKQTFIEPNLRDSPRLPVSLRQQMAPGRGVVAVPVRAADNVIGTLAISTFAPHKMSADDIHLLNTLSEIAGNAIQRTMFHEQTERRLQNLTALSEIDKAISSSFDLDTSLGTLLTHVVGQLGIDAADVLIFDANSLVLERVAERGFHSKKNKRAKPRLDKSYAGQAIMDREMVKINHIMTQQNDELLTVIAGLEDFVSYYAVPLQAKGSVKGVLEIFKRDTLEPDEEWLEFLNTLAQQAAIAIDNANLFEDIQRSNAELSLAYDATIEGWSHALDLRDRETEGHTLRVTDMTLELARAFELSDAELAQVRWGALLHDIGKMGIPDTILHKPGTLTDTEWAVMRKHPAFAYDMLSPIRYLQSALDIPYCHHEKWDGTGYPRGLRGKQIPLPARIFAIVDVWDALTSDRPYRQAWPKERALEYVQSLSGTHFDPRVVEMFVKMFGQ